MIFNRDYIRVLALVLGIVFFTGHSLHAEDRVEVTEFVYGEC